jgi:hypothetical protein
MNDNDGQRITVQLTRQHDYRFDIPFGGAIPVLTSTGQRLK